MSQLSRSAGIALAALGLGLIHPAQAQTTVTYAQDDASAYTTGFVGAGTNPNTVTQSNHGTGFNPFVFKSSSGNFAGWYLQSGNTAIGTGTGQNTLGIYASTDATTTATRSFDFSPDGVTPIVPGATTPLLTGQTLNASFQNRDIATGHSVGFSLADSTGAALFTFDFLGGTSNYRFTDGTGTTTSSLGYTQGGLNTSFLLTGANAYTFTTTRLSDSAFSSQSGTFTGAIDRIVYFCNGSSNNGDVNFSALSITGPAAAAAPEPSQMAVLAICALGLGGLMLARRRQNMRLA